MSVGGRITYDEESSPGGIEKTGARSGKRLLDFPCDKAGERENAKRSGAEPACGTTGSGNRPEDKLLNA